MSDDRNPLFSSAVSPYLSLSAREAKDHYNTGLGTPLHVEMHSYMVEGPGSERRVGETHHVPAHEFRDGTLQHAVGRGSPRHPPQTTAHQIDGSENSLARR